jgi:hypothetical protein
MPARPPNTSDLTAISTLDAVPGLRLADRDWRALVGMRHPVKVALWLALMRPVEELEVRAESFAETVPVGDEGVTERRALPAVIAWAEAAVLKGLRGDMQAWSQVADRIEGKVGHRKDDVDPEDERRRGDIQSVIEAVVTGLVNARLEGGEDFVDITPETVLDSERQDSDTARRRDVMEAARREAQDSQERGERLATTNDQPEERDLTDPLAGPRITNGRTNGHG